MQSVQALEAQLNDAKNDLVYDHRRLGELRASKAFDAMSDDDAAELRTIRARIRDRVDEIGDLEVALKIAQEFEASAAGQKRRDDASATVLRAEAVGLALEQAAALEDAAGAAYEAAMNRRSALQHALQQQARRVFEALRSEPADDQRSADQVALLTGAAEGGIPAATAFRVLRLAAKTKGLVVAGPGAHFDAAATLTVAGAARSSLSGLLMRLAGVLQAAGVPVPDRGLAATQEHAARIVAAMADDTAGASA